MKKSMFTPRHWLTAGVGGILLGGVLISGCASYESLQGVNTPFVQAATPEWVRGKTGRAEVLDALGPPSQIIALNGGSVLYYLRERGKGSAAVFVVYNFGRRSVEYDRAVFFFDENDVLTDYSYSEETQQTEG